MCLGPNQVKILPDEEFEKMLRGSRPGGGAPMPPMNPTPINGWNANPQPQEPWNAGVDMSHHPPHGFQDDLQRPFWSASNAKPDGRSLTFFLS